MQALEAIKVATDVGEPLSGRMLLFDALSARIRIVCFLLWTITAYAILIPFISILYFR
jgi:molybdopterin/thiamine biosynthesis adenylyltransferase